MAESTFVGSVFLCRKKGHQERFLEPVSVVFFQYRSPRKVLGARQRCFFSVNGHQERFLEPVSVLFFSKRSPRKVLGARQRSFLLLTVTKKGSWSPLAIIFAVNGHQERFLEPVSDHFCSKRSPRKVLGARQRSFLPSTVTKKVLGAC
jgi:hypothetical protein